MNIPTAFCLFKYSNLKFLKYPSKARGFGDSAMELGDRHALLLGAVTVTDGDGIVFQGLVIHRDTERSSD